MSKLPELWFSYDPTYGFETHDTEEAAQSQAEKVMADFKDDAAGDGWDEEVTQICWGKVIQRAEETMRKKRPPEDQLDCGVDKDGTIWGEWDEIVDYDLRPLHPDPAT